MAVERMPITPAVLTWARERAGYTLDELAGKRRDFKRVAEWESGTARPTYRQLQLLAADLWVSLLIFFFPSPPNTPSIELSFRTLGTEQFAEIPPRVRLLLYKARAFQNGLSELNNGRSWSKRRIVQDLRLSTEDVTTESASQVRDYLGISLATQFDWNDADVGLKQWRKGLHDVGVAVFKDAFKDANFCGFCLSDDEFPLIYVNNSSAKTRQTFTLFHELAHLLFNTSGIDTRSDSFVDGLSGENRRIEIACNRLAADILVPEESFDEVLEEAHGRELARREPRAAAAKLANRYCVSREVIFRKMLDRELVTAVEYQAAAREWAGQMSAQSGSGGNYYYTKIAYLGEDYIQLAFRRFYEERIDEEELADYLAIKPKHIDKLEDVFYSGAHEIRS